MLYTGGIEAVCRREVKKYLSGELLSQKTESLVNITALGPFA